MMRQLSIVSGVVLVVTGQGLAEFTGVIARDASAEVCTPLGFQTVRLYATFSDPDDMIMSVGGHGDIADFELSLDGGMLVNDPDSPFAGVRAEDFASAPFGAQWDSYVTIGADTFIESETAFSPGFAGGDSGTNVISGALVAEDDGGWHDYDPGTPVTGTEILVAQITFDPKVTSGFTMQGSVVWIPPGARGGIVLELTPFAVDGDSDEACRLDLDGDSMIGVGDLVVLLTTWGTCGEVCCPSDIDGSGGTDLYDLLLLLLEWGKECQPGH